MLKMRTEPINQLVDGLPQTSVTTYLLQALDFAMPGEWQMGQNFDEMVRDVSGETDPVRVEAIKQRAVQLYTDPSNNYQKAMWIYKTVDNTDMALAAAALANKVGQRIGFLSFLTKVTPKADTVQTIDLAVKLGAEVAAFGLLHGVPGSVEQFRSSLVQYSSASKMRMMALICVDGLIPLGPDFTQKAGTMLAGLNPSQLGQNKTFQKLSGVIPGGSNAEQLGFLRTSLAATQGWMNSIVQSRGLTPQKVTSTLQGAIAFSDDKLDYLGAFLDAATNYYEYTGTQSIARQVITAAS
ncbi:MAG TPA: hypothetical protein VLL52_22660 [Anaerolineae bacterium]|nr:hypothetical protein [Anaerolineae bacterium]